MSKLQEMTLALDIVNGEIDRLMETPMKTNEAKYREKRLHQLRSRGQQLVKEIEELLDGRTTEKSGREESVRSNVS